MYPAAELTRLADRKATLRRAIGLRRAQCVQAAARLARPVEWLDRVITLWRRLSPLALCAAVPLGLLVQRAVFPRLRILRSLVRWGSLVLGAARLIHSVLRIRSGSSRS